MPPINRRTFVTGAVGAASAAFASGAVSQPGGSGPSAVLPTLQIGKHQLTRLVIGGNPFSFISHSEPLIYGPDLFKRYFTHEKVVETLRLAVKSGINTFLGRIDENVLGFLKLYEKTCGHRIPWFAQTGKRPDTGDSKEQVLENIRRAADFGAVGCYVRGVSADYLVEQGKLRDIEDYLALMRKLGMIAGVGAHANRTVEEVEKAGLKPAFYMKTINPLGYYATEPDRTAELMARVACPWIGFKVLAAGRIQPEEGFRYAVKAGADFICVGMFDFQVESNVALASKVFRETS